MQRSNEGLKVGVLRMVEGYGRPDRRGSRLGIVFSQKELKDLAIAVGVLTICFSIAFTSQGILSQDLKLMRFLTVLPISFLAVITAFALHEIAHKVTANHFGYVAAFSYSRQGLILAAVVSILFGFLWAAPGAVFIYGHPSKRENGIISIAGPATNLVIGIAFTSFFFAFAVIGVVFEASFAIASAFGLVASVNVFIGLFNMLPLMPFDGAKIWKWNKVIYVVMLVLFIPMFLFFIIL